MIQVLTIGYVDTEAQSNKRGILSINPKILLVLIPKADAVTVVVKTDLQISIQVSGIRVGKSVNGFLGYLEMLSPI